jgi:hypothetical protein
MDGYCSFFWVRLAHLRSCSLFLVFNSIPSNLKGCGPLEGCPRDYKGKEFDQVWQIKYAYRSFHHQTRHHGSKTTRRHWDVFGTVQREHFDPLSFSKVMGDYPEDGTPTGARWAEYANVKQLYG